MNFQDEGFSLMWMVGGGLVLLLSMSWAVKTAPWYKVVDDRSAQHVLLGASVVFFLVWNFAATIGSGLSFHLLLMTLSVLMFGAQFALMSAFLALLGVAIVGNAGWQVFGLNFMVMAFLPVMISWWLTKLAYRYLDRSFFVFVLFNGFFVAAFSTFVALIFSAGVMALSEVQTLATLKQSFLPYIPMMVIPEGFVTGMTVGAMILIKPHWLSCFTDEQFLKGK